MHPAMFERCAVVGVLTLFARVGLKHRLPFRMIAFFSAAVVIEDRKNLI